MRIGHIVNKREQLLNHELQYQAMKAGHEKELNIPGY